MSEEKVIQHSKNALHHLNNKEKTLWSRIKGFLEEVFIIIVAVSITLMVHNWNDRRQEREIERNFLVGIREDLKQLSLNTMEGLKDYQPTLDYYQES